MSAGTLYDTLIHLIPITGNVQTQICLCVHVKHIRRNTYCTLLVLYITPSECYNTCAFHSIFLAVSGLSKTFLFLWKPDDDQPECDGMTHIDWWATTNGIRSKYMLLSIGHTINDNIGFYHMTAYASVHYDDGRLSAISHENSTCFKRSGIITLTSYWARWRLKSPVSLLFTQLCIQALIKENIEAPRHRPLCGEFTGDRWIPRTNGL